GPCVTNTDLFGAPDPSANNAETPAATDKPRRRRAPGLNGMVLAELQQLAGSLGISGTGRMRKSQLIEAIRAAQGASDSAPRQQQIEPAAAEPSQRTTMPAADASTPAAESDRGAADAGGGTADTGAGEPTDRQEVQQRNGQRRGQRGG